MSKIKLNKVEFYITNVCNLTCAECNRYNNYDFKGWQRWSDYSAIYQRWSELLEINHVVIMGGEPLLNSTICDWALGLKKLKFTNAAIQILSNGTRINHVPNLYQTLSNPSDSWLGITIHNHDEMDSIMYEIETFLQAPVKKLVGPENNRFGAPYCFVDNNRVEIPIWIGTDFVKSAIVRNGDKLTLHNSDPIAAHGICNFALSKNYHFIKGKLYKCGPVALLPEFDQQLGLDISDQDRDLLNSYKPLTLENFESYHKEFFDHLDNPIPQCKFCPSQSDNYKIWAIRKGKDPVKIAST
jgi:organic radical activating enzyme